MFTYLFRDGNLRLMLSKPGKKICLIAHVQTGAFLDGRAKFLSGEATNEMGGRGLICFNSAGSRH